MISDSAVYYNRKKQIFVVTYVDDFLLIGPSSSDIQALKARLARAYAIEDRGPADYFLGVQIRRDRSKGILSLSQTQYIEEALDYFNLSNPRTIQVPLQASLLTKPSTKEAPNNAYPPEYLSKTETQQYQSIVGTVMYLMTQTRLDITFTVQWLSRALQKPTKAHQKAVFNLLRYLSTTRLKSIQYSRQGQYEPIGYCDSDFAGDRTTAKSTFGYLVKVAGGPVSWKSKRASIISLSTLEAEYTALIEATREI